MKIGSILAIYALFWVMSLFLVLPFGVRTDEEAGVACTPGHADSAPHGFSFGRVALRATILAAVLFGIFYLNYVYGWVGADAFDWLEGVTGGDAR
jgi:predicted secreted protein